MSLWWLNCLLKVQCSVHVLCIMNTVHEFSSDLHIILSGIWISRKLWHTKFACDNPLELSTDYDGFHQLNKRSCTAGDFNKENWRGELLIKFPVIGPKLQEGFQNYYMLDFEKSLSHTLIGKCLSCWSLLFACI